MKRIGAILAPLALVAALAVACDSGGPPAVPAQRSAVPSGTPAVSRDEIVYVAEPDGIYAMRPGTGEVTGRRPALPGTLAYASGRLFTVEYPRHTAGGVLSIIELSPVTLEPVATLYERSADGATTPEGAPRSSAALLADESGSTLSLVHTHPNADGGALSITTFDLRTGTSRITDIAHTDAGGPVWSAIDPGTGLVTIVNQPTLTSKSRVFRYDPATSDALELTVNPDRGYAVWTGVDGRGPVSWGEGGLPYVLRWEFSGAPRLDALLDKRSAELPGVSDKNSIAFPTAELLVTADDGRAAYYVTPDLPQRVVRIDFTPDLLSRQAILPPLAVSRAPDDQGFIGSVLGGLAGLLEGSAAEAKGMDFIHPALSPDGSRLYVYGLERAPFTTEGIEVDTAPNGIWEIDTDTMKPLRHLCAGERWSGDLRVSPDGRLLALLDLDGDRLLVLDTASGQHVAAVYVDYFSPDAQIVGFGSGDWRW